MGNQNTGTTRHHCLRPSETLVENMLPHMGIHSCKDDEGRERGRKGREKRVFSRGDTMCRKTNGTGGYYEGGMEIKSREKGSKKERNGSHLIRHRPTV